MPGHLCSPFNVIHVVHIKALHVETVHCRVEIIYSSRKLKAISKSKEKLHVFWVYEGVLLS